MAKVLKELFAIDGTWLWPPDGYQEEPVPVIGYNLSGEPIRQGYPAITFTWSFMKQEHLSQLFAAYQPNKPRVKINFINREKGAEVGRAGLTTAYGMMHEPLIGARQIVYYNNIAVRFTHVEEAAPAAKDFDLDMLDWKVDNVTSGATAVFEKDTTQFVSAPNSGRLRFGGSGARINDIADARNPARYRLIDTIQIRIAGQMRSNDTSVQARLLVIWFNGKGVEISRETGGSPVIGETGWELRNASFNVPNAAVHYSVGIRAKAIAAKPEARINIDDFSVDYVTSTI